MVSACFIIVIWEGNSYCMPLIIGEGVCRTLCMNDRNSVNKTTRYLSDKMWFLEIPSTK